MEKVLLPSREIGYAVNVTYNGDPFYVYPCKADEWFIAMQKYRYPEKGIYYLFDKGIIVYIGISLRNVWTRIEDHFKDKIFDSYYIFTCLDEQGNLNKKTLERSVYAEKYLIKHFKPKYNDLSRIALIEASLKKTA